MGELRNRGVLTDAEFTQAKAKLLKGTSDGGLGRAANRAVTVWIVLSLFSVALVIGAFVLFLSVRGRAREDIEVRFEADRAALEAREKR